MTHRRSHFRFWQLVATSRPVQVGVILTAAVLAGIASDWLRAEQRLLFPRPLPVFETRETRR